MTVLWATNTRIGNNNGNGPQPPPQTHPPPILLLDLKLDTNWARMCYVLHGILFENGAQL